VLSGNVLDNLEGSLQGHLGTEGKISEVNPVGGGSINQAYVFSRSGKKYFIKINSAKKFPGMFAAEAKGLELLSRANSLIIPKVILTGAMGEEQFIVLEFLERSVEDSAYFYSLGEGLAGLHRNSSEQFGLDHSNYIGSLPQDNTFSGSWSEFFAARRLEPLLKQAIDSNELPSGLSRNFHALFIKLNEIIPDERPALLHGDLWSGNKMNTLAGPCIFDPAVYYGHREVDIAMSRLFGGFDAGFYRGYQDTFPLEKGWEGRVDIFNLYPLLVHVNLFGGGYAGDVISIMRKF